MKDSPFSKLWLKMSAFLKENFKFVFFGMLLLVILSTVFVMAGFIPT